MAQTKITTATILKAFAALKNCRFEYWQSTKDKKWYWHFKAINGEIVAASQGYSTKQACLHGIAVIKSHAALAEIKQLPNQP